MNVNLNTKAVLVTGSSGFIGANLVINLLKSYENLRIIGIDNMNDYYDVSLKEYRLKQIDKCSNGRYKFIRGDIADKNLINTAFEQYRPQIVVNFAAQAGVRYSITNPDSYIQSNLIGFYNILEPAGIIPSSILFMQARQVFTAETRNVPFSTK